MLNTDGIGCGCASDGGGSSHLRRRLRLLMLGGACAAAGCGLAAQLAEFTVPDHWCRDAHADALQEQLPLTPLQVRQFTVPARRAPDGPAYSQCHRFQGDTVGAYLQWVIRKKSPFSNSTQPEIYCDQGWHYNFTESFPTITTQMNWVCYEAWKLYVIHGLFCVYTSLGVYFWTYVAQRCGVTRALLLALAVGFAGSGASLLPPISFAQVAASRSSAAISMLAAPLLALRLLAIDVERDQSEMSTTATAAATAVVGSAQRSAAVALVVQSALAVAAAGAALFVPAWYLSVAVTSVFGITALLLCWQIVTSSKCLAGSSKTLFVVRRVVLEFPDRTTLDSIVHGFVLLSAGAAYFGLWLWTPRLVHGSPTRAMALVALPECTAWPLPLLLASAPAGPRTTESQTEEPKQNSSVCLQRIVTCCALTVAGILLTLLGTMPTTDVGTVFTMALLARAAAAVALYCGRQAHLAAAGAGAAAPTRDAAAGEAMVGAGATVAVLFAWLGQETDSHFGLIILGTIVILGAFCDIWVSGRPLYRRADYLCGYIKTTMKFSLTGCSREGSANFKNSNLPYGTLENM